MCVCVHNTRLVHLFILSCVVWCCSCRVFVCELFLSSYADSVSKLFAAQERRWAARLAAAHAESAVTLRYGSVYLHTYIIYLPNLCIYLYSIIAYIFDTHIYICIQDIYSISGGGLAAAHAENTVTLRYGYIYIPI